MALFNVTAPDGSIIPVDAPDGATEQQAIAFAASIYKPKAPNSGVPVGRSGVAAIPGYGGAVPASTAAPARPESGFMGKLLSPVETAVTLGTGLITAPIVGAAKIGGTLFSGDYGTQKGIKAGEDVGRKVQQFFQGPAGYISPESEAQTQAIGNALASTGLEGVPLNLLGDLQRGVSPALRATADAARAPIAARAAKTQQARVDQSYANAPMIEATQAALRIGGAVPPAISNPTRANVIKGKLAGPEVETQLAKKNEIAVTERVREDLGIKPNERLTPEIDANGKLNVNSPITRAIDEASAAYEPIRKIESLAVPDESIKAIEGLKKQAPIGGGAKTDAINALVDDAVAKLQQTTSGPFSGVGGGAVPVGRSGAAVLDDIRSLRRDAQATYQAQKINPDPLAKAKADTQMSIANILEGVIDANATSPEILGNLKAARTRIAQINDHVRAIDYGQQKIDPQVYAKLFEDRQGAMTGLNADIAKAASMFPDYFTLTPAQVKSLPRITRGGFGGALGAAMGAPLGLPGILAGTSAGMAVGATAGSLAARRISTPAYQRANALAPDYRPLPTGARPVEPNATPNGLMPYDYSQQTFTPPNFVMQPGQYGPRVSVEPRQIIPNTLGYDPNVPITASWQQTRLRKEDVMDRAFVARRVAEQEAQQAAIEAATRQPARGGTPLVFDERGRLVEAPVTAGAAIPAPTALESAVAKMSGQVIEQPNTTYKTTLVSPKTGAKPYTRITKQEGETTFERGVPKAFDMTAEEKIAWNKVKVDLAGVEPGMKTLSDKALADKMLDRQWVQGAIDKAKQQAAAFDEMSKRNISAQRIREAVIKREQMLDVAEMLQEQLGSRPVQRGNQGPKTQAAQRNKNALNSSDAETKNALIGK